MTRPTIAGLLLALAAAAATVHWYGRTPQGGVNPPQPPPRASDALPTWAEQGFSTGGSKFEGDKGDCQDRCGRLPQIGKTVAEMRVAAAAPAPQGGPLTPGTYVAAEMTEYTGPGGATGPTGLEKSFTMRIDTSGSQTVFDTAYVHTVDNCDEYQQSGTMTAAGTWLKISLSCWTEHPTPQELVTAYTATEDTLVVFNSASTTVTFVRQR